MKDGRADKYANDDKDRRQNQEQDPSDAHGGEMRDGIVSLRQTTERSKKDTVDEKKHKPKALSDKRVNERIGQAAFTFHGGEGDRRPAQDHLQRLNERIEEWPPGTVIPRQTAARRRSVGRRANRGNCRSCLGWWRWRRCASGEFRHLRKLLPSRHSFAPPQVSGNETSDAKSLAHFFFRKCSEAGGPASNVNRRHTWRFSDSGR